MLHPHHHWYACLVCRMKSSNGPYVLRGASVPLKLVWHAERARFDATYPYAANRARIAELMVEIVW